MDSHGLCLTENDLSVSANTPQINRFMTNDSFLQLNRSSVCPVDWKPHIPCRNWSGAIWRCTAAQTHRSSCSLRLADAVAEYSKHVDNMQWVLTGETGRSHRWRFPAAAQRCRCHGESWKTEAVQTRLQTLKLKPRWTHWASRSP